MVEAWKYKCNVTLVTRVEHSLPIIDKMTNRIDVVDKTTVCKSVHMRLYNSDPIYRIIMKNSIIYIDILPSSTYFQIYQPLKKYFERGRQMAAPRFVYASTNPYIIYLSTVRSVKYLVPHL